jgi:hypothetical protein
VVSSAIRDIKSAHLVEVQRLQDELVKARLSASSLTAVKLSEAGKSVSYLSSVFVIIMSSPAPPPPGAPTSM